MGFPRQRKWFLPYGVEQFPLLSFRLHRRKPFYFFQKAKTHNKPKTGFVSFFFKCCTWVAGLPVRGSLQDVREEAVERRKSSVQRGETGDSAPMARLANNSSISVALLSLRPKSSQGGSAAGGRLFTRLSEEGEAGCGCPPAACHQRKFGFPFKAMTVANTSI